MKVTIIKPDGIVGVDGIFINIDLSSLPDNLRVVQWQNNSGHVEWTDQSNTDINSLSDYQWVIDAWQAEKSIVDSMASDPYYGLNIDQTKEKKKVEISAQRYTMETSGIQYNGVTISTDRESAQILDSVIEKIRRGVVPSIEWKCPEGYITLTAANIDAIELAVLTHIQSAFSWEKAEVAKLDI
jgi:hypothetical protein